MTGVGITMALHVALRWPVPGAQPRFAVSLPMSRDADRTSTVPERTSRIVRAVRRPHFPTT